MNAQEIFLKTMGPPRKRLTALKLDEISAVTRPANEHAKATLMKAADAPTPQPLSFDTLDAAVDHLVSLGDSKFTAYGKAARLRPDLVQKLNAEAPPTITKAKSAQDIAADMLSLEQQAILSRSPGMSRTAALSAARKARPDLIDALR